MTQKNPFKAFNVYIHYVSVVQLPSKYTLSNNRGQHISEKKAIFNYFSVKSTLLMTKFRNIKRREFELNFGESNMIPKFQDDGNSSLWDMSGAKYKTNKQQTIFKNLSNIKQK